MDSLIQHHKVICKLGPNMGRLVASFWFELNGGLFIFLSEFGGNFKFCFCSLFFLVLLNHALLPVTEVWDETPYFGSLFDYVVLGESKSTYKN